MAGTVHSHATVARGCPSCGGKEFVERVSVDGIDQEIKARSRFVRNRLDYRPAPYGFMDLTEFIHGGAGRLLSRIPIANGFVLQTFHRISAASRIATSSNKRPPAKKKSKPSWAPG